MAMEYATKGSLVDYLKSHRPSKCQTKLIFKKISLALKYIHLKGYSHRDLKLDNILIFEDGTQCYPKLSDFGYASYCFKDGEKTYFNRFKGTEKAYMAP
jgi:serine/threonine protein kinase